MTELKIETGLTHGLNCIIYLSRWRHIFFGNSLAFRSRPRSAVQAFSKPWGQTLDLERQDYVTLSAHTKYRSEVRLPRLIFLVTVEYSTNHSRLLTRSLIFYY